MKKISVSLSGHQTSISLEQEFLEMLHKIANIKNISVAGLISEIDDNRKTGQNLSSAIRVWILDYILKNHI